jgi:hypothetical protein
MPLPFDYFRVVASLQYAHGSHWHSVFDCDSFDLVFDFAASIPILSSHAGRTFTDIIVILRIPSSALRSISDSLLIPIVSPDFVSVFRPCCDRCAPFTTAFLTLYSQLSIGLDSFDVITDFEASTSIVFFRCWPFVRLRHYRHLATSFISYAFDIGCHLSLRFSSFSA